MVAPRYQLLTRRRPFSPLFSLFWVKPEISIDLLEQTISGTITIDAESQAEQVPLLVDVLNGIEGLARDRKHPIGVIIDEFQQVISLGGQSAEGQIRAAIQEHRKVGFVFAGSKTRMLAEMTSDHPRPFYSAQRTKKLTREIIQLACQTLLEETGDLYAHIWNQLTPYQKIALIETRRKKGVGLTSRQTLKRARLNASTMRKSLEALRDKSILREEERPNETRWRFEDPLFGMWVELLTT